MFIIFRAREPTNSYRKRPPPPPLPPPPFPPARTTSPVAVGSRSAGSHRLQHEIREQGWSFWLLPKSQNVLKQIPAAKLIQARVDLSARLRLQEECTGTGSLPTTVFTISVCTTLTRLFHPTSLLFSCSEKRKKSLRMLRFPPRPPLIYIQQQIQTVI